jgi:hypothetical protein
LVIYYDLIKDNPTEEDILSLVSFAKKYASFRLNKSRKQKSPAS